MAKAALHAPSFSCAPATPSPGQEALADAPAQIEAALGEPGRDGGRAADLWTGLVSGQWSLVEAFERCGRRYSLARWNPPATALRRALNDREREVWVGAAMGQSNKHIAGVLGLPVATVAGHLRKARCKLEADTALEALIGLLFASPLARQRQPRGGALTDDLCMTALGETLLLVSIPAAAIPPAAADRLTASEREVALLAARGLSNASIAAQRGRSLRTVANQLATACAKLGVAGRRELRARLNTGAAVAGPRLLEAEDRLRVRPHRVDDAVHTNSTLVGCRNGSVGGL